MATSLGGFLQKMLHPTKKPPKFQAISLRRFGALILPRFSLGKISTTPTASRFSPLRMTYSGFVLLSSLKADNLMEGGNRHEIAKNLFTPSFVSILLF
jgi:hypothetical protein